MAQTARMERLCPERWRLPQHRTCLNWEVAEQTNWELSRRSCAAIQLVDLCELWISLLVCAGAVFTGAKDVGQSNGPTHRHTGKELSCCLPQSNVALDARSFQRRQTLAACSCVNVGDRRQEAICQRAIVAFSILASIKACPSRGLGMRISLATRQTLLGGCCG